jgi:hypothetical protein
MFDGNEILGSCGIWPLSTYAFDRIKEGIIPEEMVTANDLVSPEQVSECAHWYFAGIPMRTERGIFRVCRIKAEPLSDKLFSHFEHD